MKRVIVVLVASFFLSFLSARNILDFFQKMSDDLNPHLDNAHKMELIDNFFQGKDSVENLYQSYSKIEDINIDNHFLVVKNSRSGTFALKLFILGKDTIIGTSFTACAPLCDSEARFYSTDWSPLQELFAKPTAFDFFRSRLSETDSLLFNSWGVLPFVRLTFSAEDNFLYAFFEGWNFLDEVQQKKVKLSAARLRIKYELINSKSEFRFVLNERI